MIINKILVYEVKCEDCDRIGYRDDGETDVAWGDQRDIVGPWSDGLWDLCLLHAPRCLCGQKVDSKGRCFLALGLPLGGIHSWWN